MKKNRITDSADSYPAKLKEIFNDGGYVPKHIFNADEAGLCYRMLSKKTLATQTDAHKHEVFKKIKDRAMILFCVSKTGNHKIKSHCIGKFQNPRCFSHMNRSTLPLISAAMHGCRRRSLSTGSTRTLSQWYGSISDSSDWSPKPFLC